MFLPDCDWISKRGTPCPYFGWPRAVNMVLVLNRRRMDVASWCTSRQSQLDAGPSTESREFRTALSDNLNLDSLRRHESVSTRTLRAQVHG